MTYECLVHVNSDNMKMCEGDSSCDNANMQIIKDYCIS